MEAAPSARARAVRGKLRSLTGKVRHEWLRQRPMVTYAANQPESHYIWRRHVEFDELLPRWLAGNACNNGGDLSRYFALILNVKQVLQEGVAGDLAELGVFRGNSAAILSHFAAAFERKLYLCDTFKGFDRRDLRGVDAQVPMEFDNVDLRDVRMTVGHNRCTEYVVGYFPDSITSELRERRFSVVHLDCDLYNPIRDGLEFFYPRLNPGGILIVHDYSSGSWPGVTQAVDEFTHHIPERLTLLPDTSGSALLRKNA